MPQEHCSKTQFHWSGSLNMEFKSMLHEKTIEHIEATRLVLLKMTAILAVCGHELLKEHY